jgi:hypothetical protein
MHGVAVPGGLKAALELVLAARRMGVLCCCASRHRRRSMHCVHECRTRPSGAWASERWRQPSDRSFLPRMGSSAQPPRTVLRLETGRQVPVLSPTTTRSNFQAIIGRNHGCALARAAFVFLRCANAVTARSPSPHMAIVGPSGTGAATSLSRKLSNPTGAPSE